MNTPTSKTRALCVATRCTTVEQFVSTFHRFCGDDETFFVATMTSRPIGLETPFSIQLADKQPVLRGLCIVLDAWATPENRYKRPGIRLGIKRLTADSQVIYDRLKAASRTPEGTSGPTPQPQLAAGSQPPGSMRRPATPPPLPPLSPPRTLTPPAVPAIAKEPAPPLVVRVPPLGAGTPTTPPTTAPRLSRGSSPGSPPRDVATRGPAATPPALPSVSARTGTTRPGLPSIPPRSGEPKPSVPSVVPVDVKPAPPSGTPADAKPAVPSVVPVDVKPVVPDGSARTGDTKPGMPSAAPVAAKPAVPSVVPVEAKPVVPGGSARTGDTKPGMSSAVPVEAPPAAGAGPDEANPAAPGVSARTGDTKPGMPSAVPPWAPPDAAPAPAVSKPIAVTRFQIALRVDSAPAPLNDVEFKPTELAPRKRFERIIGEPSPSEASSDDALPAVIIDRMSGPVSAEPVDAEDSDPAVPSFARFESTNPTIDPLAERRTPGSSLVLPANPLQNLSDESIEGFVDCTLYEETENIFHPGVDGPEWADVTAETPMQTMAWAQPRPSPPSIAVPADPTVPAMPYDTPPNLTVRVQDGTESLAVAPDDPALSRAAAGELGARLAAAAGPEPLRPSSGPLGVPSAEIIDDPPPGPPPDPPAVIVDDPALSRAVAGEVRARPAAADPESHSRSVSGELWSETLRRTPAAGLPRLQPRPETPLPRPATNVPMDLGQSPDPASWFDSVSLPHSAGAPRPAMTMEAALAPGADAAFAPGDSDPALAMAPEHSFAPPPDPAVAPGSAFAPGVAVDPSLLAGMPPGGVPPGMAPPGMAMPGFVAGGMPPPGMAPPGMLPPGMLPPGGMPGGMPPGMTPPGMPPLGAAMTPPGMPPLGPGMAPPGMAPGGMPLGVPPPGMSPAGMPPGFGLGPGMPPGPGPDPTFAPGLDPAMTGAMPPGYGVDSAQYPRYPAADLVALPGMPVARVLPPWQRWLLIGGSAVVAIILAFVMARIARGSDRAAPASPAGAAPAPVRAAAPPPVTPAPAAAPAGAASAARSPASGSGGDPDGAPAGDGDPSGSAASDEDGQPAPGGTQVVGSGPCRFTVATTPAAAAVRFDDQPIGASPITINGSCDKHKVDVAHVRYQSVTKWVTLSADRPQQLDINLPRPIHAVTVTSSPSGAELSIDGRHAGTTPTVVQVAGFATVNLTFTKAGFPTVTRKVYSKVAQDRVFVKLTK